MTSWHQSGVARLFMNDQTTSLLYRELNATHLDEDWEVRQAVIEWWHLKFVHAPDWQALFDWEGDLLLQQAVSATPVHYILI